MKRYVLNILALFVVCGQAMADNVLSVKDIIIPQGGISTVEFELRNTDEVTALQFDLMLPEGLSVAINERGRLAFAKSQRIEEHSLMMQENEPGEYRVLLYSSNLYLIEGNSGPFMTLTIQAAPDLLEGTVLTGQLTGILLTQVNETRLTPADVTFNVIIVEDEDSIGLIREAQEADGNIYDLSGRRVIRTTKGVYIKNSQRILVK